MTLLDALSSGQPLVTAGAVAAQPLNQGQEFLDTLQRPLLDTDAGA